MVYKDPLLLNQITNPTSVKQPVYNTGVSTSLLPDPWKIPSSPAKVAQPTTPTVQGGISYPPTTQTKTATPLGTSDWGKKNLEALTAVATPPAQQGSGLKLGGSQGGQNETAEQYLQRTDPESLANFKKANPGLTFGNEDLAKYNSGGSADNQTQDTNQQNTGNWEDQMRAKYGITPTVAPVLPSNDNTVSQYGLTPEAINSDLEAQKAAIKAKYDILRREAATKTESERQSNLSGLYSLGEVNPMSSGSASIGSASQDNLNKRNDAITAAESEEVANATNRAYGYKNDAQSKARQSQQDTEQKIKDQNDLERQNRQDNIDAIKNAMSIQATGKQMQQTDKDNAWKGISNLLTNLGTAAFTGADAGTLAKMEKAAGIPAGTLSKGLKTLKEQELTGKANNLKEIDGSLYNITYDAQGNPVPKLVVKGTSKTDSGLTPAQIKTTVDSIASSFHNEPIVKEYNTVASTVKALDSAGVNPTDDIQRVYAFAKIMDPNSAVREGEYKTVQDYSAALLQRTGINLKRVFSNTGFLTPEARTMMSKTLNNVLAAKKEKYDSLASEYQRQIDDAYAGKNRTITNYAGDQGGTDGWF